MGAPARKPAPEKAASNTVGVRELRQNLSRYLQRVLAGETLEVTEHGRPVAVLAPLPPANESIIDRMIREGRARPAKVNPRDLGPPLPALPPGEKTLSETLEEQRAEERY